MGVGEEGAVVVVEGLVREPAGEEAVVVVGALPEDGAVVGALPEDGAVVVVEPSPGAEAAGVVVVPVGGAGAPVPGVLGALPVGFVEDGVGLKEEAGPLAALAGNAPASPDAPAPGRVAPASGSAMLEPNG